MGQHPFTSELEEAARNCRAVCFGSLAQRNIVSRETIYKFLDAMPDDGKRLKIFDINLRQNFYTKEIIAESLYHCNILKINDEELVAVGRMFGYPGLDMRDKCWLLLGKCNLDMLVLTCGTNGSYVFTPGHMSFQETPCVEVADTVGAATHSRVLLRRHTERATRNRSPQASYRGIRLCMYAKWRDAHTPQGNHRESK